MKYRDDSDGWSLERLAYEDELWAFVERNTSTNDSLGDTNTEEDIDHD